MVCDVVLYFGFVWKQTSICEWFVARIIVFATLNTTIDWWFFFVSMQNRFYNIIAFTYFFFVYFFFSWNWLVRICTHAFHRFTGLFLQIFMVGGGWEIAYNKNKKEKYVSLLLIQFMWWKWGFVAQYYLFYWFLLEHEHWGGPNFYYSGYSSAIAFHRS